MEQVRAGRAWRGSVSWWKRSFAVAVLAAGGCIGGETGADAGNGVLNGISYEDIGTPCVCELTTDGQACRVNPTNTCANSRMTCVTFSPDPGSNNAGNPWWEAPNWSRFTNVGDAGVGIEGECTLVAPREAYLQCPRGTVAILMSSGLQACKRQCLSDQECGRPGWVCDKPLLDRSGIDQALQSRPPEERGLNLALCRPACTGDFPDCLRSTPCTMGAPGCIRSAYTRNAPADLGIYIGDRNGGRVCNRNTGACDPTVTRNNAAIIGSHCASAADCPVNYLCVTDNAYASPPVGSGFCTYADCDVAAPAGQVGACSTGMTCERAFEMGMCFLDCRGGTLCDVGQKCAAPNMYIAGNLNPNTGGVLPWKANQCIECGLYGQCP